MKYIRTKDGIKIVNIICDDRKHYCDSDWNIVEIENSKIVDTIEELCDEFVMNNEIIIGSPRDGMNRLQLAVYYAKNGKNVYGAIWTDKGLIYVAKMNKKGELELI